MKQLKIMILGVCLLASPRTPAQESTPSALPAPPPAPIRAVRSAADPSGFEDRLREIQTRATGQQAPEQRTRFDLDFPGGTPRELAKAIEVSRHKPLNLIVPDEAAQVRIPAMKMTHVDLPELFQALSSTSEKRETRIVDRGGRQSVEVAESRYTIQARGVGQPQMPGQGQGAITDDTVWCFIYINQEAAPVLPEKKICRFFNLAPYLDDSKGNLKIEAITTAIETGWKMLGEDSIPAMKFHPDTKLLIAVGESFRLEMIDMVLKELGQGSWGGTGATLGRRPQPAPPGSSRP